MAGESQERDVDGVEGFAALIDSFEGPMTAFSDLDDINVLAGVTVLVFLVGIWGYSVLS